MLDADDIIFGEGEPDPDPEVLKKIRQAPPERRKDWLLHRRMTGRAIKAYLEDGSLIGWDPSVVDSISKHRRTRES